MKKHRQHHVWKSSLREWTEDNKIFCLQDGRIFPANINDVAVERHFYKTHNLSNAEIDYIRKFWIEPSPPQSHRVHEMFLTMFSVWARLRENIPTHLAANEKYSQFIEEQIINAEEDYHAERENAAKPLIDALKRRDVSFYADDEKCTAFLHFLSLQYFRTSLRANVIERFKTRFNIDITRCWNIMSHIFATNLGSSLFLERKQRHLTLVQNDTSLPFVTSDQPVINLLGGMKDSDPPQKLSLYYPISPSLAVILDEPGESTEFATQSLTLEMASRLNGMMVAALFRQAFGVSRDSLSALAVFQSSETPNA